MMRKCHIGWRAAEDLRSCFTFSVGKMFLIEETMYQMGIYRRKKC
jgi:hypothetical protein